MPNGITNNAVFAFQSYVSRRVKLVIDTNSSAGLELQCFVEFNTSGENDTPVMPAKTKPDVQSVMHHSPKSISREQ